MWEDDEADSPGSSLVHTGVIKVIDMECLNFINRYQKLVTLSSHPHLLRFGRTLQGNCLSATDQRFKAVVVYWFDTPFGVFAMMRRKEGRLLRRIVARKQKGRVFCNWDRIAGNYLHGIVVVVVQMLLIL